MRIHSWTLVGSLLGSHKNPSQYCQESCCYNNKKEQLLPPGLLFQKLITAQGLVLIFFYRGLGEDSLQLANVFNHNRVCVHQGALQKSKGKRRMTGSFAISL